MIPDAAIEAAAEAVSDPPSIRISRTEAEWFARAALEAAMPAIREHIAQEIEAADTNEDCYEAARIVRGGDA